MILIQFTILQKSRSCELYYFYDAKIKVLPDIAKFYMITERKGVF